MIHALIALSLGPIGRWFVMGGLLLALIGGVWIKVKNDAAVAERARIERANQEKSDAAKRELDRVLGGDASRVRSFDRD